MRRGEKAVDINSSTISAKYARTLRPASSVPPLAALVSLRTMSSRICSLPCRRRAQRIKERSVVKKTVQRSNIVYSVVRFEQLLVELQRRQVVLLAQEEVCHCSLVDFSGSSCAASPKEAQRRRPTKNGSQRCGHFLSICENCARQAQRTAPSAQKDAQQAVMRFLLSAFWLQEPKSGLRLTCILTWHYFL